MISMECGAKSRTREGKPCRMPAMANGRCRLHGGKSTGAKTAEGLASIKAANTKHGFYSLEALEKPEKRSQINQKDPANDFLTCLI
jgi:hypothetical protein